MPRCIYILLNVFCIADNLHSVVPKTIVSAGALLLLAGCGGGDSSADQEDPSTRATGHARARPVTLERAILPRCGVAGFDEPQSQVAAGGRVWTIQYRANRKPRPGAPTSIGIVEQGPGAGEEGVEGGKTVILAGRQVSLRDKGTTGTYVGRWRTDKALYTVFANGASAEGVERMVSCLP